MTTTSRSRTRSAAPKYRPVTARREVCFEAPAAARNSITAETAGSLLAASRFSLVIEPPLVSEMNLNAEATLLVTPPNLPPSPTSTVDMAEWSDDELIPVTTTAPVELEEASTVHDPSLFGNSTTSYIDYIYAPHGTELGGPGDERQSGDEVMTAGVCGRRQIKPRVARAEALTVITVDSYPFTRYHASRVKMSYRCSSFRSSKCKAKVHFMIQAGRYELHGEHTCNKKFEEGTPAVDIGAQMRDATDRLAITDVSMPPETVWSYIRDQFYVNSTDRVQHGLTREQVKRRVLRVRRTHFGGNYHGAVKVPPLSLTSKGHLPFFKFHHVYMDGSKLERIIGWAHPDLHER